MARLIIGGNPGSQYTNTTGKVLYQLIVTFDNSCGICIQFANKVGDSWPIPFHRGCRCTQRPIYPSQTSEPFLDFREEIRKLDIAQQNRVMGAANYRLVESGVVKYEDVVTERRVRNLREVVARQKLSVDQMVKAGVPKRDAAEAYNAVNTKTHTATEQRRKQLIDKLMSAGYTGDQIKTTVGQQLATRLSQVNYANRPVVPIVPKDGKFKLPIPTNRVVPQRVDAVAVTEVAKLLIGRQFAGNLELMEQWSNKHFGKWAEGLTQRERVELREYADIDYEWINKRLRTGDASDGRDQDEFARRTQLLDTAIAKGSMPESVVAYRGVAGDFAKRLSEMKAGETVTDLGYSSTTLNKAKAEDFTASNDRSATKVVMNISVPKGTKAASMNAAGVSIYPEEAEYLLARGTKYRVIKVHSKDSRIINIDVEIVP